MGMDQRRSDRIMEDVSEQIEGGLGIWRRLTIGWRLLNIGSDSAEMGMIRVI
jgi:hypothetical protein